ncbi:TPA: hypothetical protein ACF6GX_002050 [Raoultella ornithinolytica]|uniref:hypothetical protein n=1 Tax=Raoultella ornithinolytica TaxID=54291 RepID=UPI0015EA71E6|nr:hypothetical protein [Raoultella ornithinolytica]QLW89449.1 hypothetical protein HV175_13095 [Klebsiella oxytoca]WPJ13411.1 hypothetical protein SH585_05565 [Raoultella ornithinolytica]
MKERGMIFNGEMVRALLDGRKTQTRRIMKVQPEPSKSRPGDFWFSSKKLESMVHVSDLAPGNSPIVDCHLFFQEHCCPFGAVGDRIWVREAFRVHSRATDVATLVYKASERNSWTEQTHRVPVAVCNKPATPEKWTPSLHMPRWASRITLEITDVRVERLNSISEEDATAEGVPPAGSLLPDYQGTFLTPNGDFATAKVAFQRLWESIYGEDSWKANPWVWVIKFKRIEGGAE